ncbi:uncharacterized protein LOC111087986 [Limulus polyphemus]|uniref:Uncharacterized protein LOC111087986 n=1 Tax=Limulus polyphemus TaxID=6850 RepID=A0ABM1T8X6_LIMPO|nr:uncharacterized protein LOC111087986 [Limulus polyphemus]XP_022252330.1 uncharacterized protein LOC111087986 [Limulus polyphemus]XP_022252331.1 uncharacterized protein LOC111087986 [Limulus polyphemus]XP_022252332.1 uncharacterized protein LOC111087986 [Limulus polyphemus]
MMITLVSSIVCTVSFRYFIASLLEKMKSVYSEAILGILIISTLELMAVHLDPYPYLSHMKRGTLQDKIKSKLDKFFNRLLAPESSTRFTVPESLKDEKHGIKMGIASSLCDDGKVKKISPEIFTLSSTKSPV